MKIGYAFSTYKGKRPYTPDQPVDYRDCGEFISPQRDPDHCPRIYFELPITRPVSAVLWHAPLGNGSFNSRIILFPWDEFQMLVIDQDGPGGFGKRIPKFTLANEKPPREISLALRYVNEFWHPFTSLEGASKLLPVLMNMNPHESDDFIGRLGHSLNPGKFLVLRQKATIALGWHAWTKKELPYKDRIREMAAHGVPISTSVFKQLVSRMKLKKLPAE